MHEIMKGNETPDQQQGAENRQRNPYGPPRDQARGRQGREGQRDSRDHVPSARRRDFIGEGAGRVQQFASHAKGRCAVGGRYVPRRATAIAGEDWRALRLLHTVFQLHRDESRGQLAASPYASKGTESVSAV